MDGEAERPERGRVECGEGLGELARVDQRPRPAHEDALPRGPGWGAEETCPLGDGRHGEQWQQHGEVAALRGQEVTRPANRVPTLLGSGRVIDGRYADGVARGGPGRAVEQRHHGVSPAGPGAAETADAPSRLDAATVALVAPAECSVSGSCMEAKGCRELTDRESPLSTGPPTGGRAGPPRVLLPATLTGRHPF